MKMPPAAFPSVIISIYKADLPFHAPAAEKKNIFATQCSKPLSMNTMTGRNTTSICATGLARFL